MGKYLSHRSRTNDKTSRRKREKFRVKTDADTSWIDFQVAIYIRLDRIVYTHTHTHTHTYLIRRNSKLLNDQFLNDLTPTFHITQLNNLLGKYRTNQPPSNKPH
ncbi:hypothetical protein ANTRET_LOCUS8625 [Anthophora retusa]